MSPLITGWWAPFTVAAVFAGTIIFIKFLVWLDLRGERKENGGYTHQELHDETCRTISDFGLDFGRDYDTIYTNLKEGGKWAPNSRRVT